MKEDFGTIQTGVRQPGTIQIEMRWHGVAWTAEIKTHKRRMISSSEISGTIQIEVRRPDTIWIEMRLGVVDGGDKNK